MDAERIKAIVDEWHEENFTFIDEAAKAELVARLQAEAAGRLSHRRDYQEPKSISMYEATVSICPHGNDPIGCEPCYVMSDMNYDAARERGGWR